MSETVRVGTRSAPVKKLTSEEIRVHTEEYLAKGGKIMECPRGATGVESNSKARVKGQV